MSDEGSALLTCDAVTCDDGLGDTAFRCGAGTGFWTDGSSSCCIDHTGVIHAAG